MLLDAEVALDLGQAGSDAARCFPVGMQGVMVRAAQCSKDGSQGHGLHRQLAGLADNSCSFPDSVSPRGRVGARCGVVDAVAHTARLKLEEAEAG